jgi:DNA-binding GntR family transcriptional regulator
MVRMTPVLPLPKYHQIYLVLREQLEEGRFADGMPGELALMQQFSVARVTVRRALERLASEGLIAREAGRGTRPISPKARRDRPLDRAAGKPGVGQPPYQRAGAGSGRGVGQRTGRAGTSDRHR